MPTPASNPLRLQAIDRVVAVLTAITAGADYWFTPGQVIKRYVPFEEVQCEVTYMVFAGTGEGSVELAGAAGDSSTYFEDVFITIKGTVRSDVDTASMVSKCIRDIRKAIDTDARSGVAGTLGGISIEARMEKAPITDNGWFERMNYGEFEIQLRVKNEGTYDEL
jgi:hypothetical protein